MMIRNHLNEDWTSYRLWNDINFSETFIDINLLRIIRRPIPPAFEIASGCAICSSSSVVFLSSSRPQRKNTRVYFKDSNPVAPKGGVSVVRVAETVAILHHSHIEAQHPILLNWSSIKIPHDGENQFDINSPDCGLWSEYSASQSRSHLREGGGKRDVPGALKERVRVIWPFHSTGYGDQAYLSSLLLFFFVVIHVYSHGSSR